MNLLAAQTGCTSCSLHAQSTDPRIPRSVGIPTRHLQSSLTPGPRVPAVLYVGRNPGFNEDRQGQAFVGRSGQLLASVYIGGIQLPKRASVYLTNFVRCYTLGDDPPPARSFTSCLPYLTADLSSLSLAHPQGPRLLVLLGAETTRHFYSHLLSQPRTSLLKAFTFNGHLHPLTLPSGTHSWHVFSTYHPAFFLRDTSQNQRHTLHSHNQLISDVLDGCQPTPTTPVLIPPRVPHAGSAG